MSERPVIDYTAKDYAGFRRLMLDAKREKMPEWTSESANDFGVTLIEIFAYVADILSFYQDRIATEAFLSTAINRESVLDIARMLDYRTLGVLPARADVEITVSEAVTIPAGTQFSTSSAQAVFTGGTPVVFELDEELEFAEAGTLSASVTEGVTFFELVGESTGRVDQSFSLTRFPVLYRSARIYVNEGLGLAEWRFVERLLETTATDQVFTEREDGRGAILVTFGDGVNGRVPAVGAQIWAEYRTGVGERGNVSENTIVEVQTTDPAIQSAITGVTNPLPATGGTPAESLELVRRRAPQGLRALRRAVSLDDYARLATEVPLISKARAIQPTYNTVQVFVAGLNSAGPASQEVKDEVQDYLDERKMVNTVVVVDDPVFVPLNIGVSVTVRPEHNQSDTEDRVVATINSLLDFDEVEFRQFVPVSQIYAAVSAVDGVAFGAVTLLDRDAGTGLANVQLADPEIPIVGEITVDAVGGIPGT